MILAAATAFAFIVGFLLGMTKGLHIVVPIVLESVKETHKNLYDRAVQDTVKRLNGNHKKTH